MTFHVGQRVRAIRSFTASGLDPRDYSASKDEVGVVVGVFDNGRCSVEWERRGGYRGDEVRVSSFLGTSEVVDIGWEFAWSRECYLGPGGGPQGHRHRKGMIRLGPGVEVPFVIDIDQQAYPTRQARDLAELLVLQEELRAECADR